MNEIHRRELRIFAVSPLSLASRTQKLSIHLHTTHTLDPPKPTYGEANGIVLCFCIVVYFTVIMLCYVRIYCCMHKSDHVRLLCSQSAMAYNSVDRCQLETGTRPFPLLHASAVTNTMRHARGAVVFVSLSVRICVPAHLLDRV